MKKNESHRTNHPPGRNDPCPCGSGKKYKKCCMLKEYSAQGIQDAIRSRLVEDLFKFTAKYYHHLIPEAYDFFWNSDPPDETLSSEYGEFTEINFHEWLLCDYIVDPDGYKTIVDLYLEQKKNLSAGERDMLEKFQESVLSLYEVQEVFPERGLILKDLLLGGEYEVKEKMGTQGVVRWDIFAARLIFIDDHYVINGSIYPYPVHDKQSIIDAMQAESDVFREENPDATLRECLKVVGVAFNDIWYDIARSDRRPGILTRTGEPFMLCTAEYTFSNRQAITQLLKKSKALTYNGAGEYIWLDDPNQDSPTVLATVFLKRGKLVLECVSKARLKKGKELLETTLGVHIEHRSDDIRDVYEMIDAKPIKKKIKYKDDIPEDIKQQLHKKFMREHMTKWLDEQIPALDNRTPRECVKTKKGREKVIDLLKLIENTEEKKRKSGDLYYDLTWVWQALGLTRPE